MSKITITNTKDAVNILRQALKSYSTSPNKVKGMPHNKKYISTSNLVNWALTEQKLKYDRGWLGRTLMKAHQEGLVEVTTTVQDGKTVNVYRPVRSR